MPPQQVRPNQDIQDTERCCCCCCCRCQYQHLLPYYECVVCHLLWSVL